MIIADKATLSLLKIILTQLDYSYDQITQDTRLTLSKFGMVISGNRNYNTREWLRIITKIDERIETKKDELIEMDELESVQKKVKKFRGKIFNIVLPDNQLTETASNYIEKPYINTLLGLVNTTPTGCLTKVVGPPKSGKTILLKHFSEKIKEEKLGTHCLIDFNDWGFKPDSNVTFQKVIEKVVAIILNEFPRMHLPLVHKAKHIDDVELYKDWVKECFTLFYNNLKPKDNLFLIFDNLDGIYLYQEKSEITKTEAILSYLLKEILEDLFEENTNKNIFGVISFAALMKPESSAVESSHLDLHTTQYVNLDYFTKDDIDYILELIGCSKKSHISNEQSIVIRESLLNLYHGCPYLTSHALYLIFKSESDAYDEKDLRKNMIEYEDILWEQSIDLLDAQLRALNIEKITAQKVIDSFLKGSPDYKKYSHLLQKLFIQKLGKESAEYPEYIKDANKRLKSK